MENQKKLRKLTVINSEFYSDGIEMISVAIWLSNGNTLEVRENKVIYCDSDFEPIEILNKEESAFWYKVAFEIFCESYDYQSALERQKEEDYYHRADELADLRHQQFKEEN